VTESADLHGAAVTDLTPVLDVPRLYLACPLTGLGDDVVPMETRVRRVIECIKEFAETNTVGNSDPWEVRAYAPIEFTPPWKNDLRSPTEIYDINLEALAGSDGLIVITHHGSSAGIGQEIEWARCMGVPILYLSVDEASRQIRGIPHRITFAQYTDDEEICEHVTDWLAANRNAIQDGPRRRSNRNLAFYPLTAALAQAWHKRFDKTDTALRANLLPDAVTCMLESPARLSVAPFASVLALATELGVSIGRRADLGFREAAAWVSAATTGWWDEEAAEKVRIYALLRASYGHDLADPATWARLYAAMNA